MDEDLHPRREGVDAGDTDAMEASRDLIVLLIELASRVELRHNELERGDMLLGVESHRDASAVVLDPDYVVLLKDDENIRAVAGESLIDGVIDYLINEMVESIDARGPDVHTGPLADRFESF
jgi:hypothetical protein